LNLDSVEDQGAPDISLIRFRDLPKEMIFLHSVIFLKKMAIPKRRREMKREVAGFPGKGRKGFLILAVISSSSLE